jgi:uncharacterized protein (DUF2267 family)
MQYDEFMERVQERSNLDSQAKILAKAVVSVLQEAVAPGEWQDALSTLPPEYSELFDEVR